MRHLCSDSLPWLRVLFKPGKTCRFASLKSCLPCLPISPTWCPPLCLRENAMPPGPCSCYYSFCLEYCPFPSSILSLAKFSSKIQLPGICADPPGRESPSLVSQGTQHMVLAKTMKTSWLKMTECPLDVFLRVNLPIHSGEAHGRMDLRMRPSLLLDSHTELLETRASRRLEKGQVSPHKASLKHAFPLNRSKSSKGRRHYSQLQFH